MASEGIQITTEVGRIVWGNPLQAQPRKNDDGTPKMKDGVQAVSWDFGLAIEKSRAANVVQQLSAAAASLYPNGTPGNFAWKFIDGDGVDNKGARYADREGYAGHFVFAISTSFEQPRIVRFENGVYVDHDQIKTGDYVRAALSVKAHQGTPNNAHSKPGLYLNPQMIQFVGFGEEIRRGPDAATLFGNDAVALPPGASSMPQAGGNLGAVAAGQPPVAAGQPPVMGGQAPGNPQFPGAPSAGNAGGFAPGVAGAPIAPAQQPGFAGAPMSPTASPSSAPGAPQYQPDHGYVQNAAPGVVPGLPGAPGQNAA